MAFYTKNTSGLEIGKYYWFDHSDGWAIGRVEECSLYPKGVCVLYCGNDVIHEVPPVYCELVKEPD